MAKGKKQYENVTGSIYDFLFSESKKAPDKVRPVKATGVDTTDSYVNAVTAVLEDPLLYVNKTTEDAIRDVANIDIASIELGPGPTEKVKFTGSNIRDLFNNDMKFVDKAFERMEATRKAGRASAFGWQVAGLTAAMMARKSGLDWETQDALANMGKVSSDPTKNLDTRARSVSLAEKYWSKSGFKNISKDVLVMSYGEKQGSEIYKAIQEIDREYQSEVTKGAGGNLNRVFNVKDENFLKLYPIVENTDLEHKRVEAKNLAVEARNLGNNKKADELEEKAAGYKNAQNLVNVFSSNGTKEDFRSKLLLQKSKELKKYKDDIEFLRKSKDPDRYEKIRTIQKEARNIQTQLRGFKWQDRARKLGEYETLHGSLNQSWQYIMGGNLIPAIVNGDFFDPRKNIAFDWQPTKTEKGFALGVFDEKINKKTGNITRTERTVDVHIAKTVKNNPFKQKYYDMMTEVYYLTPKGIVSTLTTGEGFAHQAYKQKALLLKKFENAGLLNEFGDDFDFSKLFGEGKDNYLEELRNRFGEEKYQKLMSFISSNDKIFKKFESLQKVANRFGWIGRTKNKVSGFFTGKLSSATKGLRTRFAKTFLKNIKGDAAKKLIGNWIEKGGVKVLVEGIKVSLKAALGATTAGATLALNFLIDIAADAVIALAMKIAKPLLKIAIMALLIITVGVFANMVVNVMLISTILGQYSHVAPNEIVLGDTDYKVPQGGFVIPGPGGGGEFPLYTGNASAIFNAIAAEMGLSVSLVSCDTDPAPDLCSNIGNAWCWAQGSVHCYMSRIPESAYNTIFRHELMHFAQAYYGPNDRTLREWGADYMSNNGGYYCFPVNGTYMRATTSASILKSEGGCSDSDLVNIAYRRPADNGQCEAYVSSTITSYLLGGSCQ